MNCPIPPRQELPRFFSHLAPNYEWQTHLLTLFSDQRWRRFTVACLRLKPCDQVLDLATGTGQMAALAAAHSARPHVVAVDSNPDMLALARRKHQGTSIEFIEGNVHNLPLADSRFAAITMGFGLRILPDRSLLLDECYRLLKPGGKIYFLETAPLRGWRRQLLLFLRPYLPNMLNLIDRHLLGYCHLLDSMLEFPSLIELQRQFVRQGFAAPRSHSLHPSLAHLHIAEKP